MSNVKSLNEKMDIGYLQGIHNGDHFAFTSLYRKYFKVLVMASNKYVKEVDVAKEIVQDVFLKMWETPFELNDQTSIKAYLYRIVINSSLNYLKREKNILQHHLKIANETGHHSLDEIQEEQELKILIYKEIELLPAQCKKVFKMSRFDGLKYKEIAFELSISEKTVENHMIKALRILRERLYEKNPSNETYKLKILSILMVALPSFALANKYIR